MTTPEVRRETFTARPFLDQKTALTLVQFANQDKNDDLALGGDRVDKLVGALIAEAPADVVERLTNAERAANGEGDAVKVQNGLERGREPLGDLRRRELEMLQELIRRRLEVVEGGGE